MSLTNYDVLTFDIVGTLIDFESGVLNYLRPGIIRSRPETTDEEILERYADAQRLLKLKDPGVLFTERLPQIMANVAESYGWTLTDEERRKFAVAPLHLPAFPDSVKALAQLRKHFRHLIAVTNADRKSARAMALSLDSPFSAVITEEDMGYSKPDARAFNYVIDYVEKLGVRRERILHVGQSQYHDMVGARGVGLPTAWIYRRHGRKGYGGTQPPAEYSVPNYIATSLDDFVGQCEQCLAS